MIRLIAPFFLTLAFLGCGAGNLSQPPSSEQEAKYSSIDSPIAVSGVHAVRNSANGIDIQVTHKNISSKSIKYVTFTGVLINAVGDEVLGELSRKRDIALEVTGPMKAGEIFWGISRVWEAATYHPNATQFKLKSIQVDFMDGSKTSELSIGGIEGTTAKIQSKIY